MHFCVFQAYLKKCGNDEVFTWTHTHLTCVYTHTHTRLLYFCADKHRGLILEICTKIISLLETNCLFTDVKPSTFMNVN